MLRFRHYYAVSGNKEILYRRFNLNIHFDFNKTILDIFFRDRSIEFREKLLFKFSRQLWDLQYGGNENIFSPIFKLTIPNCWHYFQYRNAMLHEVDVTEAFERSTFDSPRNFWFKTQLMIPISTQMV